MAGKIYVGIGGWTFEPWRGVFYPEGLTHKRELEYASRKLTSIEINGTYYSSFKPASWAKWRAETPDGFVFAMKASRFCTNRRQLAEAGESVKRFVDQGLVELGDRLGPINWQFMGTKKFDPEDIEAFLKLLPREAGKLPLRHALEVRHPSFKDPRFYDLARKYNAAIIYAHDEDFPEIDEPTADFTYARLMGAQEKVKTGYKPADIDKFPRRVGGQHFVLTGETDDRLGVRLGQRVDPDRQSIEPIVSDPDKRVGDIICVSDIKGLGREPKRFGNRLDGFPLRRRCRVSHILQKADPCDRRARLLQQLDAFSA